MEALNPPRTLSPSPRSQGLASSSSHSDETNPQTPCSSSPSLLGRSDDDDDDDNNNNNNNNSPHRKSPNRLLKELLAVHDDLRTWLEYTSFWDADYRRTILADVRQLKGLEAEKAKVLMRIRDSKPADAVAVASTADTESKNTGVVLPVAAAATPLYPHKEPLYMRKEPLYMRKEPLYPHKEPLYMRKEVTTASAPPPPAGVLAVQGRYATGPVPLCGHVAPRPAPRKDTRYFLLKSSSIANIIKSQEDNLWMTQAKNGALLTQAFRECQDVVLFFSANKSRAFQGYAKMTSPPDHTIPLRPWITATVQTGMHTTAPFRIHWLNKVDTPFPALAHLKNPLNEQSPVSTGRDGQEYPAECALRMMHVMDRARDGYEVPMSCSAAAAFSTTTAAASASSEKPGPAVTTDVQRVVVGATGTMAGLDASRWKRGGTVFLALDRETGEDLLVDF